MQATKGDWVTAIFSVTGRDGQEVTEGNEYYVRGVCPDGSIVVDCDDDLQRAMELKYFKPSVAKDTTEQEERMDKSNWRSYTFKVRSLDQVDHYSIEDDLSWANPLMIMEYGAKRKIFVYVSNTVWRKAANCGLEPELEALTYGYKYDNGGFKIPRSELPKLIALLKRIKKAKWNNPRRAECVVTKVSI